MQKKSLAGRWRLTMPRRSRTIAATVPGSVITDLVAAGRIEHPYRRDNARGLRWIAHESWHYGREFTLDAAMLGHERLLLRCHGLDTFASLRINGKPLGRADNMYRTWEFDISRHVHEGDNRIDVHFTPVLPYVKRKYREHPLYQWEANNPLRIPHFCYVRKAPYQFGWDWAPALVDCGIWKDIEVVGWSTARFADVLIGQHHAAGNVTLTVRASVERTAPAPLSIRCTLRLNGRVVCHDLRPLRAATAALTLRVASPRLWYPNGLGGQPLYELTTELIDDTGRLLDIDIKRIGLRTVRLVRKNDAWGQSFYFEVNGLPVWARGANWVPADSLPASISRERYYALIREMAAQNMNMLRVWGGGIYESDHFYDACDELGILVWQDFMFACSTYPAHDPAFLANVRAEAEDNVRRIRHHASHCLWCGNNELEEGLVGDNPATQMPVRHYNKLFCRLLPAVVHKLDAGKPYIRCSGHTPGRRRDRNHSFNISKGDTHLWWILRGMAQNVAALDVGRLARLSPERRQYPLWEFAFNILNGLDRYRKRAILPRFVSEIGWRSFPPLRTIEEFTAPADRNALSPVMEFHQQGGNIGTVNDILALFPYPHSFEHLVVLSQIAQGEHFRWFAEHWRRHRPQTMGFLHWTGNDCWPAVEWSTVDYALRRKASFYIFKRAYAPLLITGEDNPDARSCDIMVVNDTAVRQSGMAHWTLTDTCGRVLKRGSAPVRAAPCAAARICRAALGNAAGRPSLENMLLWLSLTKNGRQLSSNLVMFTEPKNVTLSRPRLSVDVTAIGAGAFEVHVKAHPLSLWTWFEAGDGASWSDNYFHIAPGETKTVRCRLQAAMSAMAFRRRLVFGDVTGFWR